MMSGPTNSPEDDLSSTLARQADQFTGRGGHDLDLAQVVARAGEIRRGRRMRASMMMAAVVLAVAVPVGITVISNDPSRPAPLSPAATPTTTPDLSAIRLDPALAVGTGPKDGYAFQGTLHGTGGNRSLGTGGEVSSIARINGGFLIAEYAGDSGELVGSFVEDGGSRVGTTWPMEAGFTVSRERSVGAYVQSDGTVVAVQDRGATRVEVGTVPTSPAYQIEAVVGENCSPSAAAADCTVYVGLSGQTETVWAVRPDRVAEQVFPGLMQIADVSTDGSVAGLVSVSGDGSCWEVRDAASTPRWKTCAHSLMTFSPDGAHVLAGPAYRDGPGGGQLTILDAGTGDIVLDLETVRNAFVSDAVWEDADHVLAQVYDNGSWAVLRFGLDGSREYATGTVPDDDSYVSPYKLG